MEEINSYYYSTMILIGLISGAAATTTAVEVYRHEELSVPTLLLGSLWVLGTGMAIFLPDLRPLGPYFASVVPAAAAIAWIIRKEK